MNIKNACDRYLSGLFGFEQELSPKKKVGWIVKASYCTLIIPAGVLVTYGIASLIGRCIGEREPDEHTLRVQKIFGTTKGPANPEDVQDFDLLKQIADEGNPAFQTYLGAMYLTGRGIEKNEGLAVEYFIKAAKQGYEEGKENLRIVYSQALRDRGLIHEFEEKNYEEALKYYELAAKFGDETAQQFLRDIKS